MISNMSILPIDDATINLLYPSEEIATPLKVLDDNALAATTNGNDIFNTVTWEQLDYNNQNEPTGLNGKVWNELKSAQIRSVCSKLGVKGVKNAKKGIMAETIISTHKNLKAYSLLNKNNNNDVPRKEVQCPYRLMNILFSDLFAEDFGSIGNSASRELLDTGTAANDKHFWTKVQAAFTLENDDYSSLNFKEDDVFINEDINPSVIIKHQWKKLRAMWKGVNADYKAAVSRFTLSGTHDSSFYGFCNGKKETYYLRLFLQLKPGKFALIIRSSSLNDQ
jgi:hypothetical protein